MNTLIDRLQEDHCNFARILDMLDDQVLAMQMYSGRGAELDLVVQALDYINGYPNMWHHPAENHIFGRLMEKTGEINNMLQLAGREHRTIGQNTANLKAVFDMALSGYCEDNDLLSEQLEGFVKLHRQHLLNEEDILFPAALEYLDDADWKDINASMDKLVDPLFGEKTSAQFQRLLDSLVTPQFQYIPDQDKYELIWDYDARV